MEILNIGPFEIVLIVIIAIILLGPAGMIEFMKKAGKFIRNIIRSPFWKDIVSTSKEIRTLPQKIVKEADLEEELKEFEAWRAKTRQTERDFQKGINELNAGISIKPADVLRYEAKNQPDHPVENAEDQSQKS